MKIDGKGRAYCKVEDQDSGLFVELTAEVYDVLSQAFHQGITGTVELQFVNGNVGQTYIRISGSKWAKKVPRGIGALIPGSQRMEATGTS